MANGVIIPLGIDEDITFTPAQGFSFTNSVCHRVGNMLIMQGVLSTPALAARTWVTAGTFSVNVKAGSRCIAINENAARRIYVQSLTNGIQVFNTANEQVANDFMFTFVCEITP